MDEKELKSVLETELSKLQPIGMKITTAICEYCKDPKHKNYNELMEGESELEGGVTNLWWLAVWIEDRLNECCSEDKRSRSRLKKVRKAYGYTYP